MISKPTPFKQPVLVCVGTLLLTNEMEQPCVSINLYDSSFPSTEAVGTVTLVAKIINGYLQLHKCRLNSILL